MVHSVNFQDFVNRQNRDQWIKAAEKMIERMISLVKAGAHSGLIATNTMHTAFDEVQKRSPMPLISIVDDTTEAIGKEGSKVVGILGTVFTMREIFYKDGLSKHGIKTPMPGTKDQLYVNRIICRELCRGEVSSKSRERFIEIVEELISRGAQEQLSHVQRYPF